MNDPRDDLVREVVEDLDMRLRAHLSDIPPLPVASTRVIRLDAPDLNRVFRDPQDLSGYPRESTGHPVV